MEENKSRAQWGSKLGFILAAAGSAVGLGNIWKFPGKAYEGGGAAFILIYVAIVILIGMPVMLSEFAIGRASKANAIDAFKSLGHKKCGFIGWIGVAGAFIITCYYSHVGGWVTRYIFSYAGDPQAKLYNSPLNYFYGLLGLDGETGETFFPWIAIIFSMLFLSLVSFIVIKGVQDGIEKFNKVGMPALVIILLILLVRALTMEGSMEGLMYMIIPNFGQVTFDTILAALGQAFYSLSLGMAIMITYSSYLPKSESISKNTALVCAADTAIAIVAGFVIVPSVIATLGSEGGVGKGGSFAFVSLAGVFEKMPGGQLFGALFYLLLFFAALTSCISLVESVVAFLTERYNWNRTVTTVVLAVILFSIGCLYTLSQASFNIKGIWWDAKNGVTYPAFGDFMEYLTDRLLIPICALGVCIFVGWIWKPKSAIAEIEADGTKFSLKTVYSILIKFVAPAAIIVILVASFATGMTLS